VSKQTVTATAERIIRRRAGARNNLPVVIDPECEGIRIAGRRGYYTSPGGKTVVLYPGAYGWPTQYHCSTRQVEVDADTWGAACLGAAYGRAYRLIERIVGNRVVPLALISPRDFVESEARELLAD
jgi:hypothetical protein